MHSIVIGLKIIYILSLFRRSIILVTFDCLIDITGNITRKINYYDKIFMIDMKKLVIYQKSKITM